MNKYLKETLKIVKETPYLDNLLEVYPSEEIERGKKVEDFSPNLQEIFEKKKSKKLIEELIKLKKKGFKFPIEDPYVSILSYVPQIIEKNPKTINKISEKLYKLSYEKLKENLEIPKKASRRIGPMFREWLKKKYKFVEEKDIEKESFVFLKGGDKKLKNFAIENLKCKFEDLTKGVDFIAKLGKNYIIGTAKFITDFGGSQTGSFYEALNFVRKTEVPENVIKIGIVDGIIWFTKEGKLKEEIMKIKDEEFIFSVLLLDEFLKERRNY
jgi:hypothetical protein